MHQNSFVSPLKLWHLFIVLPIALAWAQARGLSPSPLAELEAIVEPFGSLEKFWGDEDAVSRYERKLADYVGRNQFPCESFTKIAAELTDLTKRVPEISASVWTKQSGATLAFRAASANDRPIVFRPSPRRFHSLWFDPSQRTCEKVYCKGSDPTAPSRWIHALSSTQLYFVEADGHFSGSAVTVSKIQKIGEKAGPSVAANLVSVVGRPLRAAPANYKEKSGLTQIGPLLHVWVANLKRVAADASIYAYVAPLKRGLSPFKPPTLAEISLVGQSRLLGDLSQWVLFDPLAEKIEAGTTRRCPVARRLGGGILSAFEIPQTNSAQLLVANSTVSPEIKNLFMTFSSKDGGQTLGSLAPAKAKQFEFYLKDVLKNGAPDARKRAGQILEAGTRSVPNGVPPFGSSDRGAVARRAGPRTLPAFSDVGTAGALERALADSVPEVRGLAALSLANQGASSPNINNNLALAMGINLPLDSTAGANSGSVPLTPDPGAISDRALDALIDRRIPIPPDAFDRITDHIFHPVDAADREQNMNTFANAFFQNADPLTSYESLREAILKDPEQAGPLVAKLEAMGPAACKKVKPAEPADSEI